MLIFGKNLVLVDCVFRFLGVKFMFDFIFDVEFLCEDEVFVEILEWFFEGLVLFGESLNVWELLVVLIVVIEFDVEVLSWFEWCLSFFVIGSFICFEWNDWVKGFKVILGFCGVLEIVND